MDTKFSVYGQTLRSVQDFSGSVQEIGGVDRFEPTAGRTVGFGTQFGGMLHWCRVVEQLIIERDLRDAEVHVGFEKLSRILKSTAN